MTALGFPDLTLPQMLRLNAQRIGARTAIRQKDFGIWNPVSWQAYFERAALAGHGLRALGLPEGGHVAVLSENRIEWVLTQLGAGLLGAVTVGVYPTSPANEVAYVLGHAEAEIVVCEDQEQVDKVLERRAELPKLRRIVVVEKKGLRTYAGGEVIAFDAMIEMGAAHRAAQPWIIEEALARQSLSDVALMIYTSGSTGKPKGAMLTYRNLRAEAIALSERLGLDETTTHVSYLPLCHVAEQMLTSMAPIYLGSQVNFGESIRTIQEDLREVAPSMFLGVPRIWEKLAASITIKMMEAGGLRRALYERLVKACEPFAEKHPSARTLKERALFFVAYLLYFRALQNFIGLRRAKVAMTGAAPISPNIVRFFRTLGVPLVEVYGATETTGMCTGQRLDDLRPGCVGPAAEGVEVKLGPHNELLVKGDLVFAGYYRNEEATAAALRDGWLHTGDVVEMVGDQVKIVDRLKDIMITAGGKNLSPSEIENVAKSSVFIKECIVIGEARKYVSALIQIDFETVGKWAEEKSLAYTNFRNLVENPQVRALIEGEVAKANAELAQVSHIRRFHLLTKELDHDDDEVTATMKIRRSNIQKKYATEIEGLYA
ncbi:long-chain acyl-CoA synthetase [Xanthobacter flavus]|uniref:Long-chain acyl-CoA synthetase n=1 Tax=Xanthobacter flavus TaxID=281 RepID=A0A9W6CNJ0_XANFL|nr:AMP-binding protein [Xanthobacter flavus]MDR6334678.1 long-chain acyl-CoA synthetase [Xanthobacter flavus]GLI23301.1 long-chain-fatty-acid--CoA ligase [Xanthobacter flavus]